MMFRSIRNTTNRFDENRSHHLLFSSTPVMEGKVRNDKGQFESTVLRLDGGKSCTSCKRVLPFDCYAKSSTSKDGLQYRCKECDNRRRCDYYAENYETEAPKQRWSVILRKYKLTQEDWESILLSQDGKCAICLTANFGVVGPQTDHNRKCCPDKTSCGTCVRGILCMPCNIAVGYVENGWNLEVPAITQYLELHKEKIHAI